MSILTNGRTATRYGPAVLHVVHSLSVGGMERGLAAMLSHWAGPGTTRVRNGICTIRGAGAIAGELPDNVVVESLNVCGREPLSFARLARVIARNRPDIIHARNWNTWCDCVLACRCVRTCRPIPVLGFHGLETDEGFSRGRRIKARLLRLSRYEFTAVSRTGHEQLQRELGVSAPRIRILTNGVDADQFSPIDPAARKSLRDQMGIGSGETVIVMVGSLVPIKDHETAFAALAGVGKHPGKSRLFVVGDGPLRSRLECMARTMPSNITVAFVGQRLDVRGFLRAADVFLLSSRYEQTSIALLEAMATGLPAVVTDVGDNARIVRNGHSGIVVPPNDPAAMRDALCELCRDSPRRAAMGAQARSTILERHTLSDAADAYVRYYDDLLTSAEMGATACAASPA